MIATASLSDAQIEIAQTKADDRALAESEKVIAILGEIKNQLQKPKPEPATVRAKLTELGKTYIVPTALEILKALILKRF